MQVHAEGKIQVPLFYDALVPTLKLIFEVLQTLRPSRKMVVNNHEEQVSVIPSSEKKVALLNCNYKSLCHNSIFH